MTMSPVGVTNEVLLNAKLMQAQLLIHTHTPEIIWFARDVYDINLEIHSMKLGDNALLIQVDLEDLFTGYTVTTFGHYQPMSNILDWLNNRYTVCTMGEEF